jgi:hypothetical protein
LMVVRNGNSPMLPVTCVGSNDEWYACTHIRTWVQCVHSLTGMLMT